MAIQKNEYWNGNTCSVLALAILFFIPGILWADDTSAIQQLKDTYHVNYSADPNKAESLIVGLETALTTCKNQFLAVRIEYRIGILYFRAGKLQKAREQFSRIAKRTQYPLLIQASSLNMTGQILRMKGANQPAVKTFDQLCALLEKHYPPERPIAIEVGLSRLWYSALLARAEIFQAQQNNPQGVIEYQRLIKLLSRKNISPQDRTLIPFVYEKMAQRQFRTGNTEQYLAIADRITAEFPQYPRVPLIHLETECLRFCQDKSLPIDFNKGPWNLPVQIIGRIGKLPDKAVASSFLRAVEELIGKYQDSPWADLLHYHFGWLLDGLEKSAKAAEIFAKIGASDNKDTSKVPQDNQIIKTTRQYAKIQYAIILAENAEYSQAMKVLQGIPVYPESSHLGKLSDVVSKNIQILKREVRSSENNQK